MNLTELAYLQRGARVKYEGLTWVAISKDRQGRIRLYDPDTGETERASYKECKVESYD